MSSFSIVNLVSPIVIHDGYKYYAIPWLKLLVCILVQENRTTARHLLLHAPKAHSMIFLAFRNALLYVLSPGVAGDSICVRSFCYSGYPLLPMNQPFTIGIVQVQTGGIFHAASL